MNLAETYASHCGVKIDLPWMKQKHYPLPRPRYITLHSWCEKETNRRYAHWQLVVDILERNLKEHVIVQIGELRDQKLNKVWDYCGKTDMQELNYLIANADLHLGYDSFPMHLASMHDKPLVCIFRNYVEHSYPVWSSKNKVSLLVPEFTYSRPPYGIQEREPAINSIPPELIASEVIRLLQ